MNNFIFKSANRLIKNSPIPFEHLLIRKLELLLEEQRHQRSDLKTVNDKLDKLLVDKHLQMQVDDYFKDNANEDSSHDLD